MSSEPSAGEAVAWNLDLNSSEAVHQAEPEGSGSLRKPSGNSTAGGGFGGGGNQEKKNAGERDLKEGNGEGLHLGVKSSSFSLDGGSEDEEALKPTTSMVDSNRHLEIKVEEPKHDEEHEQQVNQLGDGSLVRKEEILNRDVSSHKVEEAPKSDPVGGTLDSAELGQSFDEKKLQSGEDLLHNGCKSAFSVGDMVWGKVRSHPWWPGQIFHPSFASEMALKHQKKDHFLVAYFGDKTFAWNDESRLKPFESPFPHMAEQSSLDAFLYAVNEALEEVARRMEIGMTCGCIVDEFVADLKYQEVENAGIKEGACFPIVDQCLIVSSFMPDRLLKCIHELAQSPCRDYDKLELIKLKAQIKAIFKSKGYPVLPEFYLVEGLVLENEEEISAPISEEAVKDNVDNNAEGILLDDTSSTQKRRGRGRPPGKMKQVECILSDDTSSMQKRRGWGRPPGKKKHVEGDSQKQKSLPELMKDTDHSSFLNSNKGKPGVKAGSKSSCKMPRMDDSDSSDSGKAKKRRLNSLGDLKSMSASPSSTRAMIIGQRISQVVSEMKPPCPFFECEDEKFNEGKTNANGRTNHVDASSEIQIRDAAVMQEYCSPSEMLSQLCIAATDPTNVYSFQTMIVSFFTDWKDSHVSDSFDDEELANLLGSIKGRKKFAESDLVHVEVKSDFVQDSYWSDIIFQEGPKKEGSSEVRKRKAKSDLKQQNKKTKTAGRSSFSSTLGPTSNSSEHVSDGSAISNDKQLQEERLVSLSGEKIVDECNPAALILNFSDPDALPSMSDLTRIFSQYGPLRVAETDVSKKNRRASVVFERGADAEVAFSSAGKFSAFGPALVSYRLKYSTSSRTTPKKKNASPIEGGTADLPDGRGKSPAGAATNPGWPDFRLLST